MTHQSDISGEGHGSVHSWQNRGTPFRGATHYTCRVCGAAFTHLYHRTPAVFVAMREYNVPLQCRVEEREQEASARWDST